MSVVMPTVVPAKYTAAKGTPSPVSSVTRPRTFVVCALQTKDANNSTAAESRYFRPGFILRSYAIVRNKAKTAEPEPDMQA